MRISVCSVTASFAKQVSRIAQLTAFGLTCMNMFSAQANAQLADHPRSSHAALPLQEFVYFTVYWFELQSTSAAPAIILGGGYQNPQVHYASDGSFFSGVLEKVNTAGQVTDVIYTTHGATNADDLLADQYILHGLPCSMCDQVVAEFAAVWSNPRYANAHIHIGGMSLGAEFTQYIFGYSVANYGLSATQSRADFTQFAPPASGPAIAQRFGLPATVYDGLLYGYDISNDIIRFDPSSPQATVPNVGTMSYLAAYHPIPNVAAAAVDDLSAHWPSVFGEAFGLPAWLTPAQQAGATSAVVAKRSDQVGPASVPLEFDDPTYGPAGAVSFVAEGDAGDNVINGTGGNDVIIGGAGKDIVTGGAGADLFVYNDATESGPTQDNADVITDFSSAEGDQIDLRGINATIGASGTQNILFVGMARVTGPNQVGFWIDGNDTWIGGQVGSATAPNFFIHLKGIHQLSSTDFLLSTQPGQPTYNTNFVVY